MSLLKQVEDKGVTVAWSPLNEARTLLAAGSKEGAGGGFDDYGGELQVFDADFSTPGAGMVSWRAIRSGCAAYHRSLICPSSFWPEQSQSAVHPHGLKP